jgi:hypothetical protein
MNSIDLSQNLELIAALVDGRLSADERARALKLLAESDEALELYASTLRHQADTSAVKDVKVIPLATRRPFRGWRVIVPIAAAAALVIVAVPSLVRRGTQADPARAYASALSADPRFAAGLQPGWDQRWTVMRGAEVPVEARGPVAGAQETRLAFRLGVRSVDLQVALSHGDTALAARLATEVVETLRGIAFSDLVAASYTDLGTRLATDSRAKSVDRASRAEHDLRDLLGQGLAASYSFGQWSGAAELAAQTRDASFFKSTRGAAFVHSSDIDGLATEDRDALRAIDAQVKQGLTDPALAEMHGILQAIIRRRGG